MLNNNQKFFYKEVFRKGNHLMAKAVSSTTCPLGDINKSISRFEQWLSKQPTNLREYFEKAYEEATQNAINMYYRPVIRGRDGNLYSAADMDDLMTAGL